MKWSNIQTYKVNFEKKLNPLSDNHTKWSNTLKQFVGKSRRLSVFDHFLGLTLKGLLSNKYNSTFSASLSD